MAAIQHLRRAYGEGCAGGWPAQRRRGGVSEGIEAAGSLRNGFLAMIRWWMSQLTQFFLWRLDGCVCEEPT